MSEGGRRVPLPPGEAGPPPEGGVDDVRARLEARSPATRMAAVQASATGWSTAQVAVLGLLGIAGVQRDAEQLASVPPAVQYVMAAAALGAFGLAAAGALLIARTAWPLYREVPSGVADDPLQAAADVRRAQGRLRRAVPLTVGALVLMGVAFTLSWWPVAQDPAATLVRVVTPTRVACGTLVASTGAAVAVDQDGSTVVLAVDDASTIAPVASCP